MRFQETLFNAVHNLKHKCVRNSLSCTCMLHTLFSLYVIFNNKSFKDKHMWSVVTKNSLVVP